MPLRSTIKKITPLMGLQRNQLLALLTGVQYSVAALETWGALKSAVSPLSI